MHPNDLKLDGLRVHVVDPPGWTPPYDHALCCALVRARADVTFVTAHFPFDRAAAPVGYRIEHAFRRRPGRGGNWGRRAARLATHVPEMLAYARRAPVEADVLHYQWLRVEDLDAWLLPRARPRVLTAHDVLARDPRWGQHAAQRRLYHRMDAVVVHSHHGARRLQDEVGLDPETIHVIPHGAFEHLVEVAPGPLPPELGVDLEVGAGTVSERAQRPPVVLFFGLLRPYKGVDDLLEAWSQAERPAGAELWIVGEPLGVDVERLKARADRSVRWALRYISTPEAVAVLRRADLITLPYREIDQSGVLFTALAFGVPLLLTAVGGFPEIAGTGAAALVPPRDPAALAAALTDLLNAPERLSAMSAAAGDAASPDGPFGWDRIGRQTLALYQALRT
jgi:glycosyltransferase involved in cell wall biosynthesis